MKLSGKENITGSMVLLTGTHIGGMKETFQIGGQDSPVIKTKSGKDDVPYIPGSSIKGKVRCLLERKYGKFGGKDKNEPCGCGNCNICKLFGSHKPNKKEGEKERQGALIFRDAIIQNKDDYTENGKIQNDLLLETKPENIINRIKGMAEHPRFIERVVPGVVFSIDIVFNKYESDNYTELLKALKEGFELLQNDYIGGSGSRGYGRVDVSNVIASINEKIKE